MSKGLRNASILTSGHIPLPTTAGSWADDRYADLCERADSTAAHPGRSVASDGLDREFSQRCP